MNWKTFTLLLSLLFIPFVSSFACDSSNVSLLAYNFDGVNHNYQIELCIGGGILGGTTGAEDFTETIAIATYKTGSTVNLSSVTPSITSTETNVTMNANIIGALGNPFFSENTIGYIHTSSNPFACISSTALCGLPASDCFTISFSSDVFLDSVKVFGVEGRGNPIAGCTGNADMKLNLIALLPVEYSYIEALQATEGVELRWETSNELNHDFFTIEHSLDGAAFEAVGQLSGEGVNGGGASYSFQHLQAPEGWNYYRIRQTDFDGQYSYSPRMAVKVSWNKPYKWKTLLAGQIYAFEGTQEPFQIEVFDAQGRQVRSVSPSSQSTELNFQGYPAGVYWIRIRGNQATFREKIQVYP